MPFDPKAIQELYPKGSHGGQCVIFCRKLLPDLPYGLMEKWKKRKVLEATGRTLAKEDILRQPFAGLMIVTDEGHWGHVAVVNQVLGNAKVRVSESNYGLDETIDHGRIVDLNSTQLAYGWVSAQVRPAPGGEAPEGRRLSDWEEEARKFGLEIGMKDPEGALDSPWVLLETLRKYHHYANSEKTSPEPNRPPSDKGQVLSGIRLNVRSGPSEAASKLGILAGGEEFEILGKEGEWIRILHQGSVGFVHGSYVEIIQPAPVKSSAPPLLSLILKAKTKMKSR